ncbi:hypothetical protein L210DRAFT_3511579 [Boletus edulis BED1]|uniref:Uncharacterized protein n=1 Tax=Boletus edulis BED1 TaxID=1328754 RepID=A0AAD4BC69_BOLED|nr:hypothetical protein L210DRAFT_3511579 [Boletus edulis BED1]
MDEGHMQDQITTQAVVVAIIRSTEQRTWLAIFPVRNWLDNQPDGTVVFSNDPEDPPTTAHLTSLIKNDHVKRFYFTRRDTARKVLERLSLVIATYIRRNNDWVRI